MPKRSGIRALRTTSLCVLLACVFLVGWPQAAIKSGTPPPEARLDVNHATLDQLLKVPGMTHTWAARIVRFRPYNSKADLLDRGVVTSEVYNRIKDYVIAHREKQ